MVNAHYDDDFYSRQIAGSVESSKLIIPFVKEVFDPKSIVDVGCGLGGWLRTCGEQGIVDVLGIEGAWVEGQQTLIDRTLIKTMDLNNPVKLARNFDVAMSLEVAEHLEPASSEDFVDYLCSLSDVVLFSAAIPGQGGDNHINEQWQSSWAKRFDARGYAPFDIIRPRIWNLGVEPWYAQNLIAYVSRGSLHKYEQKLPARPSEMLDIVHPRVYRHQRYAVSWRETPFLMKYKLGFFLRKHGMR